MFLLQVANRQTGRLRDALSHYWPLIRRKREREREKLQAKIKSLSRSIFVIGFSCICLMKADTRYPMTCVERTVTYRPDQVTDKSKWFRRLPCHLLAECCNQRFRDNIFPKLILKSSDNNLTALISFIIIGNNKSITCLLNSVYNLSSCVWDTGLVAEWINCYKYCLCDCYRLINLTDITSTIKLILVLLNFSSALGLLAVINELLQIGM
jgi:hypothetical protein